MNRVFPFSLRRLPPDPLPLAEIYDNAAGSWQDGIEKLGFDAAYADLIRTALASWPHRPGMRVLDAGCGTGALSVSYCNALTGPPDLDLLDLSPLMLAEAQRALPFAQTLTGAVGGESPEPACYNRILCAHVIEHTPDPEACLHWFASRLRPGGVLILSVSKPHWCTALVRWRWKHSSHRPRDIQAMLQRAGFQTILQVPFRKGPPSRVSCGYVAALP